MFICVTMWPQLESISLGSLFSGPNFLVYVIVIFFCLLLLLLLPYFAEQLRRKRLYEQLPCLPTSSFFGTVLGHLEYFWKNPLARDLPMSVLLHPFLFGFAQVFSHAHGGEGLFTVRLGPFQKVVILTKAKAAEAILSSSKFLTKTYEYTFISEYLGKGLVTGNGEHWKRHRKLITPSFHMDILKQYIPAMNHQIGTFCRNIDSKMTVSGKALIEDVRPLVGNFSLDIICQTAMGVQVNAQVDDLRRQELAVSGKVLKPTAQSEFVNSTIDFIDVASQRLMRQIVERMNQFNFSVIDKQITAMKGQTERPEEGSRRMSGRRSFLDQLLMLKGESKMNLEEVQEEVNTFMGAGSDTTSTTLQLALLLLGLNVDKQKLAQEEVDSILGATVRDISAEDAKRMFYLEMCIKETLRLYPSAPYFGRTLPCDMKCDKYLVPAGAKVFILAEAIHRDVQWYDQPEVFRPERFSKENAAGRHPFAFVPFSAGPRSCIGSRFAMLNMKLFLATLLHRYTVHSVTKRDQLHLTYFVVAKPIVPIKLVFKQRRLVPGTAST